MIKLTSKSFEENLSKIICDKIRVNENRNKIDSAKIEYGLSILLINVFKLIQLYLVAIFLQSVWQTLLVHASFLVVRRYSYGYHSSKSSVCSFWGIFLFGIIPHMIYVFGLSIDTFQVVFFSIMIIPIIAKFSPQSTKKNHLQNTMRLRIKAVLTTILVSFFACFESSNENKILMVYGLILVSILLIIGEIKNKGELIYEH